MAWQAWQAGMTSDDAGHDQYGGAARYSSATDVFADITVSVQNLTLNGTTGNDTLTGVLGTT